MYYYIYYYYILQINGDQNNLSRNKPILKSDALQLKFIFARVATCLKSN